MKLTRKRILQALSLSSSPDKTKRNSKTKKIKRSSPIKSNKDKKDKPKKAKRSSPTKSNKDKKDKKPMPNKDKKIIPPLCDTCIQVKNTNPSKFFSKTNEKWQNFPHHIPVLGRTSGGQSINLDIGPKYTNRLVYYFASSPASIMAGGKPATYPDGYLPMSNVGLMQLNKKGCATLYLDCPKVYKDKAHKGSKAAKRGLRQGYMNHVHVLVSKRDMTGWEDVIFTQNVVCQISLAQFKYHTERHDRMIINAIDPQFNLDCTHANISYKDAANMPPKTLRKTVLDLAPKLLRRGLDTPLLVYCYGPECTAAKELMNSLYSAGFYNILYFPGGWLSAKGRE